MAKKTAPKKKTAAAKKPAAKPAKTATKKAAPRKKAASANGCYVAVSPVSVTVSQSKGRAGGAACSDFETAKNAAIDGLIESIEAAERQLSACKRATTLEELSKL